MATKLYFMQNVASGWESLPISKVVENLMQEFFMYEV
jgi:hypothetical protein